MDSKVASKSPPSSARCTLSKGERFEAAQSDAPSKRRGTPFVSLWAAPLVIGSPSKSSDLWLRPS